MVLRRSIGTSELFSLLCGDQIKGTYDIRSEAQSTSKVKYNVVCFFVDDYWWIDSRHRFCVTVDIPESRLTYGEGLYYAAKTFAKTHIWTGRRGTEFYTLKEAYARSYSINDVKTIAIGDYFNRKVHDEVIERLKLYGVEIVNMPNK